MCVARSCSMRRCTVQSVGRGWSLLRWWGHGRAARVLSPTGRLAGSNATSVWATTVQCFRCTRASAHASGQPRTVAQLQILTTTAREHVSQVHIEFSPCSTCARGHAQEIDCFVLFIATWPDTMTRISDAECGYWLLHQALPFPNFHDELSMYNADDCLEACLQTDGCEVATWVYAANRCYMKTGVPDGLLTVRYDSYTWRICQVRPISVCRLASQGNMV